MPENPIRDQWDSGGVGGGQFSGARGCARKNLVGNGTTVVKSTPGALHAVQVNTRASGGTATIYDNTAGSGAVIGVLDTNLTNSASNTQFYDAAFQTGLTIVIANAANVDLVVSFQ